MIDIDNMTSTELTNYLTRDGKVSLDFNRLAEAIHRGKVKKVAPLSGHEIDISKVKKIVLPNGHEIDVELIKMQKESI